MKKSAKGTNNDLQNTAQKTKDCATRTLFIKKGVNSGSPEKRAFPAPLVASVLLLLNVSNIICYRQFNMRYLNHIIEFCSLHCSILVSFLVAMK